MKHLLVSALLTILISACSNIPKQDSIRYDSSNWWLIEERYKIEKKCHMETALRTVQIFESTPGMTKDEVGKLNRFLLFKCYKYYKQAI